MSEPIPGFMIYLADLQAFSDQLSKESMGAVMFALMHFAETGEDAEGDLSQLEIICYRVMRNNVIRDHARYQKKAAAGSRGGSCLSKNNSASSKSKSASSKNQSASSTSESASVIPILSPSPITNPEVVPVVVVSPSIPTRDAVREYAKTTNTTTDPDRFYDYYDARGWELKPGTPIKNWQAVFNVWVKNEKEGRFQNGGAQNDPGRTGVGEYRYTGKYEGYDVV